MVKKKNGHWRRFQHPQLLPKLAKGCQCKYPSAAQRDRLEGLLVVDQVVINVNKKYQVYIYF